MRPYAGYFLPDWEHPQREFYLGGVLWWVLRGHVTGTLADGDHFFAYVRGPHTATGRRLPPALLEERLARLAAEQEADGVWPSPYSESWRGWTTMQNLLVLRAFGRA